MFFSFESFSQLDSSFNFTPSPYSATFYGQAQIDSFAADSLDFIGAFDSLGNCAGSSQLFFFNNIAYINLVIYGDDPTTTNIDEGINSSENFYLKLFDSSKLEILDFQSSDSIFTFSGWQNTNGAPLSDYNSADSIYNFLTCHTYSLDLISSCDSFLWNGLYYFNSGLFDSLFINSQGCDSLASLDLSINFSSYSYNNISSCDSYFWNGLNLFDNGSYDTILINHSGCDSIVNLDLSLNSNYFDSDTITSCDSFFWNGNLYNTSGVFDTLLFSSNGCDSLLELNLIINNSSYLFDTIVSCGSYQWNGNELFQAGDYNLILINEFGCDSLLSLNLSILDTSMSILTVNSCDTFIFNSIIYTTSGIYDSIFTGVNGCDSLVSLNLNISNSTYEFDSIYSCDLFNWNGVNYYNTGTYDNLFVNEFGCDSLISLYINIDSTLTLNDTVTVCDSYQWNGTILSNSGDYDTLLIDNCQLQNLNLTVNYGSFSQDTITACNYYNWNGITYYQSGSYGTYLTNAAGCDSIVSLELTINSSSFSTDSIFACNSYIWNGTVYYDSGVYGIIFTNSIGCDSILTLVLTIGSNGCTDPLANNYDPLIECDDGSCQYQSNCNSPKPSGLILNWVTDTKASVSWDNMNDSTCMVFKYFIRYRLDNLDGTYGNWVTKSAGVGNGLCNFGLNTTEKRLQFLTPSSTYQFKMKAFYCGGSQSGYSSPSTFTTSADCPPMTNLGVQTFNGNQAKAKFTWDTTGAYIFARIALRVDTTGATWGTAGGFGVYYPNFSVNKFGLTPGQSYRAQGRTFCDSNVTSYRSTWTVPIFWTQPGSLIRMESTSKIKNLDVYPNPSRDIFNIRFVSEQTQDLSIRVINIMGELVYEEQKNKFIGEYTKQINLINFEPSIYLLEIITESKIFNKKIIFY